MIAEDGSVTLLAETQAEVAAAEEAEAVLIPAAAAHAANWLPWVAVELLLLEDEADAVLFRAARRASLGWRLASMEAAAAEAEATGTLVAVVVTAEAL